MWRLTLFVALSVNQVLLQELDFGDVNASDIRGAGWSRIVSGWEARPGQHPHQALLRLINLKGSVRSCGGVVIHEKWLLTAAHCTAGYKSIVVRAGLTDVHKPEMLVESTEYYTYPTFNVSNPMSAQVNDISMIKLPIPLVYSRNLRPIRIQPSSEAYINYNDVLLYTSGFGRNWTGGHRPDILHWVYLRGISNEQCQMNYFSPFISENSLCAVGFNITTQSMCNGDNGGPLVHVSPEGEPILIGISSFVADVSSGCHSGYPSVFTRTGPFHPWYHNITGIDFESLHDKSDHNPISSAATDTSSSSTTPLPTSTTPSPSSESDLPNTSDVLTSTTISNESISTFEPTSTGSPSSEPTTSSPPHDNKSPEPDSNDEILSELLKELEVDVKVKYKLGRSENVKTVRRDTDAVLM